MKSYQTILFDLDGTLTDSAPGITNSVAYALQQMGCPVPAPPVLRRFLGPPLLDSFRTYCGMGPEQGREAARLYRDYFQARGIFENSVYDGIPAPLQALKSAGKTVVLATSKPEHFAKIILEHFGLLPFFDVAAGASMDESRTKKTDVILYALSLAGVTDKSSVVMVGDREHDILGARAAGLDSIGVLYGYGSRAEHEAAGATAIAPTVEALQRMLLG